MRSQNADRMQCSARARARSKLEGAASCHRHCAAQLTHPSRSSWRGRMRAAAALLPPAPFMPPFALPLLLLPPNCSSRLPLLLASASSSAAARPPEPSRSLLRGRRSAWLLPLSCRSTRSARPGLDTPGNECSL